MKTLDDLNLNQTTYDAIVDYINRWYTSKSDPGVNLTRDDVTDWSKTHDDVIGVNVTGDDTTELSTVRDDVTGFNVTSPTDDDTADGLAALMYLVAVLGFYSIGVVIMLVMYARQETRDYEEEQVLDEYMRMMTQKQESTVIVTAVWHPLSLLAGISGAQRELPPADRELPPTGRELPSNSRELPPAGRELPSERRELPPAGRELPPASRQLLSAREKPQPLSRELLPKKPRELPGRQVVSQI